MTQIDKQKWKEIAKQIYIDLDDSIINDIQNDWNKLESSFIKLKDIDVKNLIPTDYCHIKSVSSLRDDIPNKSNHDFSKIKFFVG